MKAGLMHLMISVIWILASPIVSAWCTVPNQLPSRSHLFAIPDGKSVGPAAAIKKALEETVEYDSLKSRNTKSNAKHKIEEERQVEIFDEATIMDMEEHVRDLKELLDEETAKVAKMKKSVAARKKRVVVNVKKHGANTQQKTRSIEAIAAAREATKEYGIHSPQTLLAWESFEAIAADELAP